MLSRIFRFQGYGSLRFVYRRGQTVRSPLLSLKYVPNSRLQQFRVAVVVSRKVNKSAVVRNRIRRRIYEIVRQFQAEIKPHDLVFTAFSDQLAEMPAKDLRKMVEKLLKKASLINK